MASALALEAYNNQSEEGDKKANNTIPPTIRELFRDLAEIRRVALVESPQILPLIAPSLIEAEVHIRQLWAAQM
jgi:hypothetical protein